MKVFERTIDPLTGLITTVGAQDGKLIHHYEADTAPTLDYTLDLRNSEDYTKRGIKRNWWHVGHISEVVGLKMLQEDGFNPWTAHASEIVAFLRKNKGKYGKLVTTEGQF